MVIDFVRILVEQWPYTRPSTPSDMSPTPGLSAQLDRWPRPERKPIADLQRSFYRYEHAKTSPLHLLCDLRLKSHPLLN